MANKYTEAMITEMRETGSFDYNSANAFAEKHSMPIRSVIAKARALEIDYQPKDPKVVVPRGRAKVDIIKNIENLVGSALVSMNKMTIADLEVLEKAVA